MFTRAVPAFIAALTLCVAAAAHELRAEKILDGKAEISIPSEFTVMSDEMKHVKYPTGNPPQVVFTDEDGAINVAASTRHIGPAKLKDMVPALANTISRVRNITTWHDKGLRTINGREFAFLEFTAAAVDTDTYNYIYFTLDGPELLMFTVNCTVAKAPQWRETLHKSVSSTRILTGPSQSE